MLMPVSFRVPYPFFSDLENNFAVKGKYKYVINLTYYLQHKLVYMETLQIYLSTCFKIPTHMQKRVDNCRWPSIYLRTF